MLNSIPIKSDKYWFIFCIFGLIYGFIFMIDAFINIDTKTDFGMKSLFWFNYFLICCIALLFITLYAYNDIKKK
jgi:uncharacterized membrane protein YhaH (DUF805 family)